MEKTQAPEKCCRVLTSSRKSTARQPDSPYAYLVCFCGVVCNLIMFGCSYSYGLLFPSLLDEFKEGKAKTGNSDSSHTLLRTLVSHALKSLKRRFRCHRNYENCVVKPNLIAAPQIVLLEVC